jgi:hypothetical protein
MIDPHRPQKSGGAQDILAAARHMSIGHCSALELP